MSFLRNSLRPNKMNFWTRSDLKDVKSAKVARKNYKSIDGAPVKKYWKLSEYGSKNRWGENPPRSTNTNADRITQMWLASLKVHKNVRNSVKTAPESDKNWWRTVKTTVHVILPKDRELTYPGTHIPRGSKILWCIKFPRELRTCRGYPGRKRAKIEWESSKNR
jgi:hypothetical protein